MDRLTDRLTDNHTDMQTYRLWIGTFLGINGHSSNYRHFNEIYHLFYSKLMQGILKGKISLHC